MRKTILLLCVATLLSSALRAQAIYPFQNSALSDDERLDNLLSLMTIDEKVSALSTNLGVPRLGIRNTGHSEGLHGLALGGAPGNWGGLKTVNYQQVPDIYVTTTFPQAYGLGETWDPDLIRQVADIEATEIRYYAQNDKYRKAGLVMRAPNADLARDPRWGRTEESFGEDPYLVSEMAVAFIRGLQGDNPRYWKSASLMKHFLANSNEDGRDSTSSNFDKQLFNDYYAYPFRKGVEQGGAQSFMAAYNAWNGTAMTVHPVLEQIRRDWNLKGIICTDGGALELLVKAHKAYPSHVEGSAAVVKAGVGQFLDEYRPYIYEALAQGILTEADIDHAIRGNFFTALRLGLLDGNQTTLPYAHIGVSDTIALWRDKATQAFVRQVTAKSVVLLKNEAKLLPLDKDKIRSIAVIGPRADEVLLDWYSGTPPYVVTILDGIRNAVGSDVEVIYAVSNTLDEAYRAAEKADVALVCVGNHVYGTDPKWKYSPVPSDGREAVDRKALSLEQEDLVKIVRKANPNTVMVLVSSFPFAINWSQANVPAILHLANNSQELGNGLADVLFGKFNPAGRTNQTWVASIADLPPMMDYDIRHGRTYMYATTKPLYPFGYGLSYTDFSYSNLKLSSSTINKKQSLTVSVAVKNSGTRDGEEVVQLYLSFPNSRAKRPIKQLKAFKRSMIRQGETAILQFELTPEAFAFFDEGADDFVVESGSVMIMLGSSSADIRLQKQLRISE